MGATATSTNAVTIGIGFIDTFRRSARVLASNRESLRAHLNIMPVQDFGTLVRPILEKEDKSLEDVMLLDLIKEVGAHRFICPRCWDTVLETVGVFGHQCRGCGYRTF